MPLVERSPAQEYDETDWMSAGEAARKYGIHIDTMYRALKTNRVPFEAHRVGGRWFISRVDVERRIAFEAGE